MTESKWSDGDEDKKVLRNKYRGISVREVHDYYETKGHNENKEVDHSKPTYKATCDTNGIKVPPRTMQVSFEVNPFYQIQNNFSAANLPNPWTGIVDESPIVKELKMIKETKKHAKKVPRTVS